MELSAVGLSIIEVAAAIYIVRSFSDFSVQVGRRIHERQILSLKRRIDQQCENIESEFDYWWNMSGGDKPAASFVERQLAQLPDEVHDTAREQLRAQIKQHLLHYVTDQKTTTLFEEMCTLKTRGNPSARAQAEVDDARKERDEHIRGHESQMVHYGYTPNDLITVFQIPVS